MNGSEKDFLKKTKWLSCLMASVALLAPGCKLNQTKSTNAPGSKDGKKESAEQIPQPGPFANDANDEELRKQFLALLAKYQTANLKDLSLAKKIDPLSRPRRAKTLNIKMRYPVAMIAKTAGRQGATDLGAPIRAAGGKIRKELRDANVVNVVFSEANDDRHMSAVMEFLSRDSRVELVAPDYVIKLNAAPNDPQFGELWGLKNNSSGGVDINVLPVWDTTTGRSQTVIGVIDTGIDCTHPDLAANCWVNPGEDGLDGGGKNKRDNGIDDDGNGYVDDWQGWNFIVKSNNAFDDHYHGTHVAGTIGAIGNNNLGVVGVNWRVSFVPLKFLDSEGSGFTSDAVEAIDYATKMKFFATSNSWGGGGYDELMRAAIARADAAGIHFIAAAGNSGSNNDKYPQYPASYDEPNVISVAAIDSTGQLAPFSCYGVTSVDVAAPGVRILSTAPGSGYQTLSGTSMATPHVTGALALLHSAFPDDSPALLRAKLLRGVSPLPTQAVTGRSIRTGGMINVAQAMAWTPDNTPPSAPAELVVVDRDISSQYPASVAATITFRESGDDGTVGKASRYVLRFSETEITDDNGWVNAKNPTLVSLEKDRADGLVKAQIKGLPFNTRVWVAVRAYDEDDNESALSPSARVKAVTLTSRMTYDGSTAFGSPTTWISETDPQRGQVYSDGVGSYPSGAKRRMTLNEFQIPNGMQRLVLRYWSKHSLETNWDFGRVYIQGEFGFDTEIDKLTGHQNWSERAIDLTSIARSQLAKGKKSLNVYFELKADTWWEYDGWMVDDIEFLVNDTFITAAAPSPSTITSKIDIPLTGAVGSLYSAKYLPEAFGDCVNVVYDNSEPQTPLTTPIAIDQSGAPFGARSLCIKAKVAGVTDLVYANYQWIYENASAIVQATGFPGGRSAQKTFKLTVTSAAGGLATAYSYALLRVPSGLNPEQACSGQGVSVSWSEYLPIASTPIISVNPNNEYFSQTMALCLRGRAADNTYQIIPTSYSWTAVFEGPVIELQDRPASPNNLSQFKFTLVSNSELRSCKAKLISGMAMVCPEITEGYVDCSEPPKSHVVNLTADGDYSVCFYGVDTLGNVSLKPVMYSWTRDTTPPVAVLTGNPPVSTADISQSLIYVSGSGVYSYRYALAKTVSECKTWSAVNFGPILLSIVPNGDGPRALCVVARDQLGNEQLTPTTLVWTQDTVAQPVVFADLPAKISNAQSINIGVSAGESGKYRSSIALAQTCDLENLSKSGLKPLGIRIQENFTVYDGPMTVCAVLTDDVGNRQQTPTSYTWTKDTKAPTVTLNGVPAGQSAEPNLNVMVGGDGATQYQWALLSGAGNCATASFGGFVSTANKINAAISGTGLKRLCVRGKDEAGNVQLSATSHDWTQLTSVAWAVSGVPSSPSSVTSLKVKIAGSNAAQYQYALLKSQNSNCVANIKYSGWVPINNELALSIAANTNGFMTLCIRGRNAANQVQASPSIYRWLQVPNGVAVASQEVFISIGQVSRARGSQTLSFTRIGAVLPAETLAARVCLFRPSDGVLLRCIDRPMNFTEGSAAVSVTFTGMTTGSWVAFLNPTSALRGRVEPLIFGY